ncbi:MAG TPA: DinB family protein [Bryobacteraceae bacterium]
MPAHSRSGNGDLHTRLAARLRDQAGDIRRLTSDLDEETLASRPVPERWSLKELVCHLWRVQEVFEMRIEAMLTETKPMIAPYVPNGDPEFDEKMKSTCAELVEAFLAEREQLLALLVSLPASDWRHQGVHPEFPEYDVQFAVEYLGHHEAHHIYQMFQRRPVHPKPHA